MSRSARSLNVTTGLPFPILRGRSGDSTGALQCKRERRDSTSLTLKPPCLFREAETVSAYFFDILCSPGEYQRAFSLPRSDHLASPIQGRGRQVDGAHFDPCAFSRKPIVSSAPACEYMIHIPNQHRSINEAWRIRNSSPSPSCTANVHTYTAAPP